MLLSASSELGFLFLKRKQVTQDGFRDEGGPLTTSLALLHSRSADVVNSSDATAGEFAQSTLPQSPRTEFGVARGLV